MNEFNAVDPTATWMQIIAILTAAADSPHTTAAGRPDLHSLALGAQIAASRAVAWLPIDSDGDLEDIDLVAEADQRGAAGPGCDGRHHDDEASKYVSERIVYVPADLTDLLAAHV